MKKSVFQKVMVAAMVGLGSLMIAPSADAKMQFYKPVYGDKIQAKATDGSTITFARTGGASFTINGVPYYGDDEGRAQYLEMRIQPARDDTTGDMVFLVTFVDPNGGASDGWLFAKMRDGTFYDIIKNDSWCESPYEVDFGPSKSGDLDTFSIRYMNHANPNKYRGRAVWWDKKLNHWNYHG